MSGTGSSEGQAVAANGGLHIGAIVATGHTVRSAGRGHLRRRGGVAVHGPRRGRQLGCGPCRPRHLPRQPAPASPLAACVAALRAACDPSRLHDDGWRSSAHGAAAPCFGSTRALAGHDGRSGRRPPSAKYGRRAGDGEAHAASGVCARGTVSPGDGGPGGVPSPNGRPARASRPCGLSHPDRSGPAGTMPVGLMSRCTW
jgi:hypothetical protein